MSLQLTVHTQTDVGNVRLRNEDSFLSQPKKGLFAVADGMGGCPHGHLASQKTIEFLERATNNITPGDLDIAVREVGSLVHDLTKTNFSLRGMGTTLSAIWFDKTIAYICHIGDSRIYLMRKGQLRQLTEDHTLYAESMRLHKPVHDLLRNVLLKCIGSDPYVQPDASVLPVYAGDRFLLCSDGLYNYFSHSQLEDFMKNGSGVKDYVEFALDQGGGDNITVILIDVDSVS